MQRLRLPSFISNARFPSSGDTLGVRADSVSPAGTTTAKGKDVDRPVAPQSGKCPRKREALPSSRQTPMLLCPTLRPRADVRTRPGALKAFIRYDRVVPANNTTKTPPITYTFEAQSYGFTARCLRFVPASQLTTQDSLAMAGQAFCAGVLTRWV